MLLALYSIGVLILSGSLYLVDGHSEQIASPLGLQPANEQPLASLESMVSSSAALSGRYLSLAASPSTSSALHGWTVLIYLAGDTSIERYASRELADITGAQTGSNTTVLVLYDGGGNRSSQVYRLANNSVEELPVQDIMPGWGNEVNMGDPETLEAFLSYGLDVSPGRYCMLELWGHGSGWAGVCRDDTDGDRLTMDEVHMAVKNACMHHQKKIDVLVYAACRMATIEAAVGLDSYVDYCIASQAPMPATGLPHTELFTHIDNPSCRPPRVVEYIIDTYSTYYRETRTATIAAWNLSQLPMVTDAMHLCSHALITAKEAHPQEVMDIATTMANFGGIGSIDLATFMDGIQMAARPDITLSTAAQHVLENVSAMIMAEWHGSYYQDAHGVSVYYPTECYLNGYAETRFASHTNWDGVLRHSSMSLHNPSQ